MANTGTIRKIEEKCMFSALREVGQDLHGTEGEIELDFSSVLRIDSSALGVMEELGSRAEDEGVRIVLRGVNPEAYKVLKLVKLARRFSFVN
jgi:anti-anti-sigma regulatory factor